MILNMLEGKPLPVYGDGRNIRDWLYVEDHNAAVWSIMQEGRIGETYNIGGENEWENIKLLGRLIEIVAEETGGSADKLRALITYVKDRHGHDRRYAIDCSKLKRELGWKQSLSFDEGLRKTVRWYLANPAWVARIRSGEYRAWIERNYGERQRFPCLSIISPRNWGKEMKDKVVGVQHKPPYPPYFFIKVLKVGLTALYIPEITNVLRNAAALVSNDHELIKIAKNMRIESFG